MLPFLYCSYKKIKWKFLNNRKNIQNSKIYYKLCEAHQKFAQAFDELAVSKGSDFGRRMPTAKLFSVQHSAEALRGGAQAESVYLRKY